MDNLLNEIAKALSYHSKSTASKLDILRGDEKLLGLIIDNLDTRIDYKVLHKEVNKIIDENIECDDIQLDQYQLVSNDEIELAIDNAIIDVLKEIENDFIQSEILRMAMAPKKMLRSKMFLKVQDQKDYQVASLIELFHLATLIQDDVIDKARTRRHSQTISDKYNDRTAILISDYLLVHIGYIIGKRLDSDSEQAKSHSKQVTKFYKDQVTDFLKSLLHSEKQAHKITNLDYYQEYASNKTAKFFEIVLITSYLISHHQVTIVDLNQIGNFGHQFGMVFQKIDDLLDYNQDILVSGKDSRDIENNINNYMTLSLENKSINEIKKQLNLEIQALENSKYGELFFEEINYLTRRVNE